jgi:dGTPase
LFKLEELVEINFFKNIYKKYKNRINKQNYKIATYQIIRDSIDLMIKDLINNTKNNLKYNKIKTFNDVNKTSFLIVEFSDKVKNYENEIRYFLKTKMYNNKNVLTKNNKGKSIVKKLFNKIKQNPKKFISKEQLSLDKYRAISDFISGMTDRYAINLYNNIK